MDKADLRRDMTARRSTLPLTEAVDLSVRIAANLLKTVDFSSYAAVHCYAASQARREVETAEIIRALEAYENVSLTIGQDKRKAATPRILFNAVIVPLVAFDSDCHRLGLGAGWYDRFLAGQSRALKIGLAYDMQQVNRVPVDVFDIPLDMVVTQSRVFTRLSARQ